MDPKVKADFPIDWDEDQYVSRREFFKFVTLASGGLALGTTAVSAYALLPKDHRVFEPAKVCLVSEIGVGQSLAFSYPRPQDLCLLIRREDGELRAYSRRCTHLSCPVEWQPEKDRLYCPCHNGAFSASDGKVLQGPPPHPLPEIILESRGGEIWATGIRKGEQA